MLTREELFEIVWSQPIAKVAAQYSVSGSYLGRICDYLNVPKPGRGYWARKAHGKPAAKPDLPLARPGDPTFWQKGVDISPAVLVPQTVKGGKAQPNSTAPERLHHLLRGAKAHFENSRRVDEGEYLRPYKKLLVDITTSQKSLDRAILVASTLFDRLERAGARVWIAGASDELYRDRIDELEVPVKGRFDRYPSLWSPDRPTIAYVDGSAVGVAIVEMSEDVLVRYVDGKFVRDDEYVPQIKSRFHVDRSWTTRKIVPSGRFRIVIYSPYRLVNWSKSWQENGKSRIDHQFKEIVSQIKTTALDLVGKVEEARRLAEIEHQRYLEQERLRRAAEKQRCLEESRKESETQLRQIIARWGEVTDIEAFLKGIEKSVGSLPPEKSEFLLARIKLAKEMLGTTDPLDYFLGWDSPDEIFASKHQHCFSDDD